MQQQAATSPSCSTQEPVEQLTASRKVLAILLASIAGVLLVVQNGVNTNLRQHAVPGSFPAACVSFSVGLVAVSCLASMHAPNCGNISLRKAPWYAYTGGLLGPVYVVCAILLANRLGFAAFQLFAITGQLTSGFLCDTVGLLHLPKRKPTVQRGVALVITVCGAAMTSAGVQQKEDLWKFGLYCVGAFVGGAVFPIQAVVNGTMQKYVLTPFRAVVVSFLGGTIILWVISGVVVASSSQPLQVSYGEPWMWTGGLCGATLITCNMIGVPTLGAAAYTTVSLASQLTTAFFFDLFGAFGFQTVDFSILRLSGVLLAISAAISFQIPSISLKFIQGFDSTLGLRAERCQGDFSETTMTSTAENPKQVDGTVGVEEMYSI